METWAVTAIILVLLAALVVFLVNRNQKDEKEFEEQIKQDYPRPKPQDAESDGTDSV